MGRMASEVWNQRLTIGVVTTCLVLAVASFVLRLWSRLTSRTTRLWWDDYWMIWVMLVCIGMSTSEYLGLLYGSGVHQSSVDKVTTVKFDKGVYASMLLWAAGAWGVKIGILLFYWRVFQQPPPFRMAIVGLGTLFACMFLANMFSFFFQCTPVSGFWDHTRPGHCFNIHDFLLASGILNVFGDVAVLLLPLPVIWSLHASRSRKISLSVIFMLGTFACIASIFRIIAVGKIDIHDFTYTNVGGGLWSTVEVQTGFICSNLPFARPVLLQWTAGRSCSSATSNEAMLERPVRTRQHSNDTALMSLGPQPPTSARLPWLRSPSPDDSLFGEGELTDKSGGMPLRPASLKEDNEYQKRSPGGFSLHSRASVRSSGGDIMIRRVVVLRVEEGLEEGHRGHSFETRVSCCTERV